jgi:heterodisulfide reductase subunit C/nitrate reductase gamma subunit
MNKQLIFIIITLIAAGIFFYSASIIFKNIKLLKKAYPVKDHSKRLKMLIDIGLGQTKIMRFPLIGFLHALVFWGFLVILFGSAEMLIDGLSGHERTLSIFGPIYNILMALGDIFAYIIGILIIVFLFRRLFLHIKRFSGAEMNHKNHIDANFALSLILLLMISLAMMNIAYTSFPENIKGYYPISSFLAKLINLTPETTHTIYEASWWTHITLIFFFANYLPYSKHFHVFLSLPNVYLSRLTPLTQMTNMESVTKEVKIMMDPNQAFAAAPEEDNEEIERFGMKDVEDGTWKMYLDSLTCTQCGRCTSVCPAKQTGKLLSPRKVVKNFRERMSEKAAGLRKDKNYNDGKSLLGDFITAEELWACTTCNACAQECPVNIDHPSIILEMRRYIFMEESAAPSLLNAMSTNIENNGAPWQYPPTDRLKWADNISMKIKQ